MNAYLQGSVGAASSHLIVQIVFEILCVVLKHSADFAITFFISFFFFFNFKYVIVSFVYS